MSEPTVCAVMLVNGRHEMVARAVRSFMQQTYRRDALLSLLMFNTGGQDDCDQYDADDDIMTAWCPSDTRKPIGSLRNSANQLCTGGTLATADIIAHWDSDDWSHPNRLGEQVALLQSSGADCVGYRDLLFWKVGTPESFLGGGGGAMVVNQSPLTLGEAWLFDGWAPDYCIGTSLCYWRRAWERKPFRALKKGEDRDWCTGGIKCAAVSSLAIDEPKGEGRIACQVPRMVAAIHGGNTSSRVIPGSRQWKRAPIWDAHCRKVFSES